jgi:hypothetical protein
MGHFLGTGPTLSLRYFHSPVGKENFISVHVNLIIERQWMFSEGFKRTIDLYGQCDK